MRREATVARLRGPGGAGPAARARRRAQGPPPVSEAMPPAGVRSYNQPRRLGGHRRTKAWPTM